jgi:AcrR family transcriptional regulator
MHVEEQERGQPLSDRRRDLVAAAFQRLATAGFEGLRTRDVAADAGVNIATLHYYFPTKEALIRGVIGHAMQRFAATLPSSGSAIERLRAHLHALAELLKTDQQLWAVMGELALRSSRDAELATILRQTDEHWHRTLSDLVHDCVVDQTIYPIVLPERLAALMILAIKGLSMPTLAGVRPELVDQTFRLFEWLLGLLPADT